MLPNRLLNYSLRGKFNSCVYVCVCVCAHMHAHACACTCASQSFVEKRSQWDVTVILYIEYIYTYLGFPGGTSGKEPACQCRRHRRRGLISGLGRSSGGGRGNLLQCSCLENPMDRRAWQATVHRVAKSQTQLKRLSTHAYPIHIYMCVCVCVCIYIYIIKRLIIRLWVISSCNYGAGKSRICSLPESSRLETSES